MTINFSKGQALKILEIMLLVAILGILIWSTFLDNSSSSTAKTITVIGEATIESAPDEYVFAPYYEATGTDQVTVQAELTAKANDVTAKLKELGVEEKNITLQSSAYDNWFPDETGKSTTTVSLEVKVSDKELSQKVQDYLITTGAKGQISPQGSFSITKTKELDADARKKASEEARSKAEAQASIFGAEIGDVVKIEQGTSVGIGYPEPMMAVDGSTGAREATVSSLPVLVGQDSYSATVSVTYELQ
jgi:uncharacterized protein YggE